MDRRAYSEANYIINSMPEKMKNKIPDDIITNIQNKISYDKENDVRHPLHSPVNDITE